MVTRKPRTGARLTSEVDVLVCEAMGSTYLRAALGMLRVVRLDPKPPLSVWGQKKIRGFGERCCIKTSVGGCVRRGCWGTCVAVLWGTQG